MTLLGAVLLAASLSSPASAHKVVADGYVAGDTIEGEIGFSNGDMAANTVIEVFDETGAKIDEVTSDDDGFFVYKPTRRISYVFRVNLGAGHVGQFIISADDLPADLGAEPAAETPASVEGAPNADVIPGAAAAVAAGPSEAMLKEMIAETVRAEVRPLRRELVAYKEKHDVQQILGGIGYIIGLFGLAFFLVARRRSGSAA